MALLTLGTAGTAGTLSATTSPDTVNVTVPGAAGTICIDVDPVSAGSFMVNVQGVHGANDFATIPAGHTRYYRVPLGTVLLTFKSSASTATAYVDACVGR